VEYNRGDGLQMALAVGGKLSRNVNTVYGHLMPAPPAHISWDDYLDPIMLTAYYAEQGIIVNRAGERFVDESTGEKPAITVNAALQQPAGGLWVILDDVARREASYEIPRNAVHPSNLRHTRLLPYLRLATRDGRRTVVVDSIRLARDHRAVVIETQTLEQLARQIATFGVDGRRLLSTIEAFNTAVGSGRGADLSPPRSLRTRPMDTPPFIAVKVVPGISMTYGGVAINERTEVLDGSDAPIPGLYAVPGTAGGIHDLYYGGSLAACGVFGKIAGEQVTATGS
jgi:succinate dehydrogenase/fumarate reductase flavoprotein subunit